MSIRSTKRVGSTSCAWSISLPASFKQPASVSSCQPSGSFRLQVSVYCSRPHPLSLCQLRARIDIAVCLLRKHCAEEDLAKRWVATVKTVSTFPPPGLFNKSGSEIAKNLASKNVSPKGPQSGMRMLNYYINRAGRNLSPARRRELNKAKTLLSRRIQATKMHKKPSVDE